VIAKRKTRRKFKVNEMLDYLDAAVNKLEASKKRLGPLVSKRAQEKLLDVLMTLIAEEVMDSTMGHLNFKERSEAAKLLLKRADQRALYAKLDALKKEYRKGEKKNAPPLTPEEKQVRMRQIFGLV